jgi:hypothetical protein
MGDLKHTMYQCKADKKLREEAGKQCDVSAFKGFFTVSRAFTGKNNHLNPSTAENANQAPQAYNF